MLMHIIIYIYIYIYLYKYTYNLIHLYKLCCIRMFNVKIIKNEY